MIVSEASMRLAVANIARHGDTDVLPFSVESYWFLDRPDAVVDILTQIDKDFDNWVAAYPVECVRTMSSVGYSGFRAVTQIDAIWNAYFLALLIELGPDIEGARIPSSKNTVFAYRFAPDTQKATLFDETCGWKSFQSHALEEARRSSHVLFTDISDFYSRVYHHRLENALLAAARNNAAVSRVKALLIRLSGHSSYGLPVGGNAARILAELLLTRTDKLLLGRDILFARFVDDYYMFFDSMEEARRGLVYLSEILLRNEGLTLSRMKTRTMTRAEFVRQSVVAQAENADSKDEADTRQLLKLRLTYDRYSPNAEENYATLSGELERFDILAMLTREFDKSRADESVVRQLVKSVRFLGKLQQAQAIRSIVQNLDKMYPAFPTVAILLRRMMEDLDAESKDDVLGVVRSMVAAGSHIFLVPANLAYAVRLLANDSSEEAEILLLRIFESGDCDMAIRRDIILAMVRRKAHYWLSDLLKRYSVLTPWEKRALLLASYTLGDEGSHWRKSIRDQLSAVDASYRDWVADKFNGRQWDVPL